MRQQRCTAPLFMRNPPFLITVLVGAVTLWATSQAGGTTHVPALVLRGLVVAAALCLWPRGPVALSAPLVALPIGITTTLAIALGLTPTFGTGSQAFVAAFCVSVLFLLLLATPQAIAWWLLKLFIGVGAVHAGAALVQAALSDSRATAGFFNPNYLAAFLAPLAILALNHFPKSSEPRLRRLVTTALVGLLVLGVLATRSRSGALALLAGVAVLAYARSWRATLLVAALGVALLVSVPSLRQRFAGMGDAFAYSRTDIWTTSVRILCEHPLGVGLGNAATALRQEGVPLAGLVRYPRLANDAHSEPLNAAIELGWLGLLLTLVPPFWLLWLAWRHRGAPSVPPFTAVLSVWLSFAIPALVSTSLHVPIIALLAATWAATLCRELPNTPATVTVSYLPRRFHRIGAATVMLVALLPTFLAALSFEFGQQALRHRNQGEPARALPWATAATRVAPWSLGAALLEISVRRELGATPDATIEALLELADQYPQDPTPVVRAAQLLRLGAPPSQRHFEAELWHAAARRDPNNARHYLEWSRALLRAQEQVAAMRAMEAGLAVEPNCADCLALAAWLQHLQKHDDRARALAEQAKAMAQAVGTDSGPARTILSLQPDSQRLLDELPSAAP